MIRLRDVADEIGVSPSFVSKVLNNRMSTSGVTPAMAEQIRACAKRLGYRKNQSAAALKDGRHNVIGVFVHPLGVEGSGLAEALVEAVAAETLRRHQKQVIGFYKDAAEFETLLTGVHAGVMDGLIVAGIGHKEFVPRLLALQAGGVPVVTVYDAAQHPGLPNVGMDQFQVGRVATRHLIERGCRRIAHIRIPDERTRGYQAALREAGLPAGSGLIVDAVPSDYPAYTHTVGRRAVETLLERGVAFDGLVAQSDQQAVGAIHALLARGRRVPADVRVIGVDNSPYGEFTVVPLSSVSQRDGERGRLAVDLLLDAIEGKTVTPPLIEPEVVARDSTR